MMPPETAGHDHHAGAGRFVGQSVLRKEDPRLLSGHGRFVANIEHAGLLHGRFVRSEVARARITGLQVDAARAAPGVVAVLTYDDLQPFVVGTTLPTLYLGLATPLPPARLLANRDVRFAGEAVAIVVATDRYTAEDAAQLIQVDYEVLAPVVDFEGAERAAELVHPEIGTNVAMTAAADDPEVDAAFERAAHVVTETFWQQRQTNAPMEPRGVVASWDRFDERMDVWLSTQNPHEARRVVARALGLTEGSVRVRQEDVGGGFGQKYLLGRDELAVVVASMALGQPVKWIESRAENLTAANHARTDRVTCSLALDADGVILAVRLDHLEDVGAFPTGGTGGAGLAVVNRFSGPYRVPRLSYRTTSVWTNTCGRGAYRGPWMMETTAREQLMDVAARQIGMDPLELRRRNVIRNEDQPYATPTGLLVDGVSPLETLDSAAEVIGYQHLRAEQRRLRAEGRYLGIGTSLFIEPQGSVAPLRVEAAVARMRPDGTVEVFVGSGAHGQGLETTMAQVAAEELCLDIGAVTIRQGDTESTPFGWGTGGSRSAPILAAAVRAASADLRNQVRRVAADMLEAADADIDIVDGHVFVRGTPSRTVSMADIAQFAIGSPHRLSQPADAALEASVRHEADGVVFSNACHIAVCEVDPATGRVDLRRYVVSEDCGMMINPMVVEGQIAGGVAQGIAGALYEEFVYDHTGTPLTTGFLDYLVPSAAELPSFEYHHVMTPRHGPGGHKGMGEGGAIGAPACVLNAVADALAPFGRRPARPPYGPAAVLATIEGW